MKTLDEVIDKLIECHTRWCRWSETSDIVDRSAVEDAIEYLKELQKLKNTNVYIPDGYIQAKLGDKNEKAGRSDRQF